MCLKKNNLNAEIINDMCMMKQGAVLVLFLNSDSLNIKLEPTLF